MINKRKITKKPWDIKQHVIVGMLGFAMCLMVASMVLFGVGSSRQIRAATPPEEMFFYTITDGEATISGLQNAYQTVTSLEIPAQMSNLTPITKIADGAFLGRTNLAAVTLPGTLTYIGDSAFMGTSITSLDLPDSLTHIGAGAFANTSIAQMVLPKFVESIGEGAFAYTEAVINADSVVTINTSGNVSFRVDNNCLIRDTGGVLLHGWADGSGAVTIPNALTEIGTYAFAGSSMTHVTFSAAGIAAVGDYAFHNSANLTAIDIPNSVNRIGSSAFEGCSSLASAGLSSDLNHIGESAFAYSGLTNITIPSVVQRIEDNTFSNCTALGNVTLHSNITYIGDYAFDYTGIKNLVIPESVAYIGAYAFQGSALESVSITRAGIVVATSAFQNCIALTEVTLANNLANIVANAFAGCVNVAKITERGTQANIASQYVTDLQRIGLTSFTTLVLPNNVTRIDTEAFRNKTWLRNLTITSNNLTHINASAFRDCGNLTSITLPDSVTNIGANAFSSSGLTSVILLTTSGLNDIGTEAFALTPLRNITLPTGLLVIGQGAFMSTALTGITIPDTVTTIGMAAFENCVSLAQIVIPNNVTSIGVNAFANCTSLAKVKININLSRFGLGAFSSCPNITDLEVTDPTGLIAGVANNFGTELARIGLTKITEISLPNHVKNIAGFAFQNIDWLTTLIINGGLTTVGASAFRGSSLISIELPESLISIDDSAFRSSNLIDIIIPDNVTTIGEYAFANTRLASIDLPNGLSQISKGLFENCSLLAIVNIPASVTSIEQEAFANCVLLAGLTLPENLESIGIRAFIRTGLGNIGIPNTVRNVGMAAFAYTGAVVTLASGNSALRLESGDTCLIQVDQINGNILLHAWGNPIVPNGVARIGDMAFASTSVTSVILPDSVEEIGTLAFDDCALLERVVIPYPVANIKDSAFASCPLLVIYAEVDNGDVAGFKPIGWHADWNVDDNLVHWDCLIIDYFNYDGKHVRDVYENKTFTLPELVALGFTYDANEFEFIGWSTEADGIIGGPSDIVTLDTRTTLQTVYDFHPRVFFKYTSNGTSVTITGLTDAGKELTNIEIIPTHIYEPDSIPNPHPDAPFGTRDNPLPVRAIASTAFKENTKVISITIPNGIQFIENNAFEGCKELTSVTLPSTMTQIGDNLFLNCESLASIVVPEGITHIGSNAFRDCTNLMSVTLPNTLTNIGISAFENCIRLGSIVLKNNLTDIGVRAFWDSGLTGAGVTIHSNLLQNIGAFAFAGTSLTSIELPTSVVTIGDGAFSRAGRLAVTFNDNLPPTSAYRIESNCLIRRDENKIIHGWGTVPGVVTIPQSVTHIGNWAFAGSAMSRVDYLPNLENSNVTHIGAAAFSGCLNLASISVPKSVSNIAAGAFTGCDNLTIYVDYEFGNLPVSFNWETNWNGGRPVNWKNLNRIALQTLITEIKTLIEYHDNNSELYYTTETWGNLIYYLGLAETAMTVATTQDQLAAAEGDLNAAKLALVRTPPPPLNRTALNAIISEARGMINQGQWMTTSWDAMQTKLAEAEFIQGKADFSDEVPDQDAIDATVSALRNAINSLVASYDRSALNSLIAQVEAMTNNSGFWTPASWNNLQNKLQEAKAIQAIADEQTTQSAINTAIQRLQSGLNALVETPPPPPPPFQMGLIALQELVDKAKGLDDTAYDNIIKWMRFVTALDDAEIVLATPISELTVEKVNEAHRKLMESYLDITSDVLPSTSTFDILVLLAIALFIAALIFIAWAVYVAAGWRSKQKRMSSLK